MKAFILCTLALAAPVLACGVEPETVETEETVSAAQSGGCALPSMYLVGTPRNFGVSPGGPLPMTCKDGQWETVETFVGEGNVFAAGAFKFLQTGNFSTGPSWGDWAPRDGQADLGGDGNDIVIESPGRYKIRFDDRALRYRAERLPSGCSRGSVVATGVSSRDGTRTLACIDADVYGGIVMVSQPNMGVSVDGSVRRVFNEPGRYLFEYRESDGSVTTRLVSPACAQSVAYARGTFNGWGLTEMECENGHYALTIGDLQRETLFKFDTKGDFSVSYGVFPNTPVRGDGHFDPARNVFGNDIRMFGRHHVHFYSDASFAFDRHD